MGKSSVEHQVHLGSAASITAANNDKRGKPDDDSNNNSSAVMAASSVSAAVSSASRDMFHGLFQDLGKQAMAMEAILRIVCGKVDSMETWMTEVAFGMTELDLKLRNIAHNIEGTAANVDDETANVYRWAAPPADDERAAVHAVPTIKKKVGPNKTTVRVTNMVASVLDTLSAPADERDKTVSAAPATTKQRPKHSPKAAVTIKKVHKKKTGHTHHVKAKEQHSSEHQGSASGCQTPTEVVDRQTVKDANSVTAVDIDASNHELDVLQDESDAKTASALVDQTDANAKAEQDDSLDDGTTRSKHDSDRSAEDATAATPAASVEATLLSPVEADQPHASELSLSAASADASSTDLQHAATEQQPEVALATSDSHEAEPVLTIKELSPLDPMPAQSEPSTAPNATEPLPIEQVPLTPTLHAAAPPPEAQQQRLQVPSSPEPQSTSVQPKSAIDASDITPGTLHVVDVDPASHKLGVPNEAAIVDEPVQPAAEQTIFANVQLAEAETESSTVPPVERPDDSVKTTIVAPPPLAKSNSRNPSKTSNTAAAAPPVQTRQAPSRSKSQLATRKSKLADTIDSSSSVAAASPAVAESTVVVTPPLTTDKADSARVKSSSASPIAVAPPSNSVTPPIEISTADVIAVDTKNSSSESESDDSSSSESVSDSQDDSDDSDEVNNEDAPAHKTNSASSGNGDADASSMTRTFTALNKLKKANMLSADEVDELKHRAQDKWFKLKGHVKEKKKKDVANILLKRKKNVFTISARIELLEDKSKEVFASIKQLHTDLKSKVDATTHESLRHHVQDMNASIQALDHRVTAGATPAMAKITQLTHDVDNTRTSLTQQLVLVSDDIAAATRQIAAASSEHQRQLDALGSAFEQRIAELQAANAAALLALPDHTATLDAIKRTLRRKADLKQLKELELRLLGQKADSDDDCLVRCLSCHKEVTTTTNNDAVNDTTATSDDDRAPYTKRANTGPSTGRIYRSNVPFSAQLVSSYESIPEDAAHVLYDDTEYSNLSTKSPPSTSKSSGVSTRRDESLKTGSTATAPPIRAITINSSRAAMSPDRPISAPATAALKMKASSQKNRTSPSAVAAAATAKPSK